MQLFTRTGGILCALFILILGMVSCTAPPAGNPTLIQPSSGSFSWPAAGSVNQAGATATPLPEAVLNAAVAAQQVFTNIYQRNAQGVVNIEALTRTTNGQLTSVRASGFTLDGQGHILTSSHAVFGSNEIYVTFNDGAVTKAILTGLDPFSDVAVLIVEGFTEHLQPVTLGDSGGVAVGQQVVTIGNPYGLTSAITTGLISATTRTVDSALLLNANNATGMVFGNPSLLQTTIPISAGFSGSPLLDLEGRVIGLNTAFSTTSTTLQAFGFAVPINTIKRVVPQLIAVGKMEYAWLGINASPLFTVMSVADDLKLPVNYGVLVDTVTEGSPAAAAGLRGGTQEITVRGKPLRTGGDLLIAINGEKIRDMDHLLTYLIERAAPEQQITLTIIRDNATLDVTVTLKSRPSG